ncbi:MAG: rRNA maturation RNase YbeY [Bacteroidales bacterium]|nr:rRNA maturation RNase YbeY [Bacteroidales bacterium]
MCITFFYDDVSYRIEDEHSLEIWIKKVCEKEIFKPEEINIILVNDEKLVEINRSYLGKDYSTDIITFDYSNENKLNGELYISYQTVLENSKEYSVNFAVELNRVIIHGVLHMMGYDDKTEDEETGMRMKEDEYLKLLNTL